MKDRTTTGLIRIHACVYDEVERIAKLTRKPMSVIATEAIRYAFSNSRVEEVKLYDITYGERPSNAAGSNPETEQAAPGSLTHRRRRNR